MSNLVATLTAWFRESLGREVGPNDSYFSMGGDSLGATEVLAKIEDEYAVSLRLKDIIEAPTVIRLALTVMEESTEEARVRMIDALTPAEIDELSRQSEG